MERLITALPLIITMGAFCQADLRLTEAGISNSTRTRSFGSAPSLQVGSALQIRATIDNPGTISHTSITLMVEIAGPSPVNTLLTAANLDPGESDILLEPVPIPLLAEGLYTATLTLSSAESGSESNLANNVQVRYFSITNNTCALDGIGVIPAGASSVAWIGTSTFPDAEDGLILMSYVDLKTGTEVEGFEALLAPGTQAGAEVHFMVLDTTDVLNGDVYNPLLETTPSAITPSDVTNGTVQIALGSGEELPPGGYFVAIELFSLGGAHPVSIKDDVSNDEDPIASLMYHPGDFQVYSNGNAVAVRLRMGDAINGLNDPEPGARLSLYPNPANDVLRITGLVPAGPHLFGSAMPSEEPHWKQARRTAPSMSRRCGQGHT
ncbi:MAG: hypothetical protein ABI432_17095 [Flavobacteriales bacterium]